MTVNIKKAVVVRVVSALSTIDPADDLPGTGAPVRRDPEICERMRAELSGVGFNVDRMGDPNGKRAVVNDRAAEWRWAVTPQEPGKRSLDLELFMEIENDDHAVSIQKYSEEIQVDVDRGYRVATLADKWGELALGISVALIGGTFALWKWRRRHEDVAAAGRPAELSPSTERKPEVIDIRSEPRKPSKKATSKSPRRKSKR